MKTQKQENSIEFVFLRKKELREKVDTIANTPQVFDRDKFSARATALSNALAELTALVLQRHAAWNLFPQSPIE